MKWQEIIREQEEVDLKSTVKTLVSVKNPQSARAIAKTVSDELKKKPKKPNEPKTEEEEIIDKVSTGGKLTPEELRKIAKESKDFRLILVDNELVQLDEAFWNKTKYVRFKYTYPSTSITVQGIGIIEDNKIKKEGFETYKNSQGESFKVVPKDKTIDIKFKTDDVTEEVFKRQFEINKGLTLAKEVKV